MLDTWQAIVVACLSALGLTTAFIGIRFGRGCTETGTVSIEGPGPIYAVTSIGAAEAQEAEC